LSPGVPNRRRGCLIVFAGLVILAGAAWFSREWVLPALAHWWVVDEAPDSAAAIFIPGGNVSTRAAAAAKLFHAGKAPLVLIANPEMSEVQKLGILPPDSEVTRSFLIKSGVPASAIEVIGTAVTSTRDEALALKEWCASHPSARVIIPTDLFHSRRVNWFMERTLAGTGTDIRVVALEQTNYSSDNWWKAEEGLIAFQNEVIKWMYYHLHY
jgi:uncharacterized SAM-binding protein YcdF (DUF218 family)